MDGHQKIRVCHIASGDLWAGAEVQVYNMVSAQHLSSAIEVSVILLNQGRLADELNRLGVETEVIPETDRSFWNILKQADLWLSGKQIDIIHSHRFKENILTAKLLRRRRAQYIVQTVHGLGEPLRGVKRIKAGIIGGVNSYYSQRYFDRIIAVSEDIGKNVRLRFNNEKVAVVYNSVVMPTDDATINRKLIRDEFGIGDDEFVIGTAGRLTPVKAYDQFLMAAQKISEKVPQARFLIAGDGPLKTELENQAKQLGLTEKVIFPGFRNDMAAVLASLDLFVMSSLHEGIPVVLLEAMALTRPVVVTAVGGMVEVVENGKSGRLVEAGNPQQLADTCIELMNNTDLRTKLGLAAAERVRTVFTSANQYQRLVEIYLTLMKQSKVSM